MPRTTIDIDASVLDELRARQRREGKTLGRLASELLATALHETEPEEAEQPFRWRTHRMGLPLVDLEDKDAVWAILDADERDD
ncbi:MAG: antitoxin [Solirubrobacterales bacterium]|nr:antitoxin [Solirubrobacterales bacterium]